MKVVNERGEKYEIVLYPLERFFANRCTKPFVTAAKKAGAVQIFDDRTIIDASLPGRKLQLLRENNCSIVVCPGM